METEENIYKPKLSNEERARHYFEGFSENLYGNNWFVLSTNESLLAGHEDTENAELNPKYTTICGILDEVPEIEFKTDIADGPQKTATDFLINIFSISNDGGSLIGAVGSALGANLSKQLAGGYTAKMTSNKEMGGDFELTFTAWKRPTELFDTHCYPSNQKDVINYLTQYATVDATDTFNSLIKENVNQAITGLASVLPIAKTAVSEAGKVMFGNDDDSENIGFLDTIDKATDAIAVMGDEVLARGWSDRQRLTIGKQKFNESLHRLDILRAGVLDTYLIVAITDWSYKLDQDSMGEKMTVKISCKVDQRMSSSRLRLYSENKSLPVK